MDEIRDSTGEDIRRLNDQCDADLKAARKGFWFIGLAVIALSAYDQKHTVFFMVGGAICHLLQTISNQLLAAHYQRERMDTRLWEMTRRLYELQRNTERKEPPHQPYR